MKKQIVYSMQTFAMKKRMRRHFIVFKQTLRKTVLRLVRREFRRFVFEAFIEVFTRTAREILRFWLPLFAI